MTNGSAAGDLLATVCLTAALVASLAAVARPPAPSPDQESTVMTHASGTFEVKLAPEGQGDTIEGSTLGRMSIDKRYHGDLEGTGRGLMLTAMTATEGSAGYVATERVDGTLAGRTGTFVLLHRGVMTRGKQDLTIAIVPDSGTGQLTDIAGAMQITIEDGKHYYDLEYSLPERK